MRIIPRENRIIRDLRLTRDTRVAKSIRWNTDIVGVSKIDARHKERILGSRLPRDAAKIFPAIHHPVFARTFSHRLRRRCNRRTNAIQLKENTASSLFEGEPALLSRDYGLDGKSPGGMETVRLNLYGRIDVSVHGQGES